MKRKNLIIGALIMLSMLVSGFTYAWWVGTANDNAVGNAQIGNGDTTLEIEFVSNDGTILIPSEYATGDFGGRDTVELTFTALWVGDGAFSGEIEMVSYVFTEIVGSITVTDLMLKDMFVVNFTEVSINSNLQFSITVTLVFENEPASEAIYNVIKGQTLSVSITFKVIPN
jgi:hypothetical protein